MRDSLLQITPVFVKHKHMLGDDYSMLDVAVTPLLWRLDYYGISMGKQAAPLMKCAERLFARPAFSEALTSAERGMRRRRKCNPRRFLDDASRASLVFQSQFLPGAERSVAASPPP